MIFFRTDANDEIATGHMMRCLTVAKELKILGEKVVFLISDYKSAKLLDSKEYAYIILETEWDKLYTTDEIKKMKQILSQYENPIIIVDSYYVSNEYFKSLRKLSKIVCFDDFFAEKLDVDLLINYSIFNEIYDYKNRYKDSDVRCLIGTKYVPIRQQFINERVERDYEKNPKNIMLMCGGGDKHNILEGLCKYGIDIGIINERKESKNIYHFVLGAYNPCFEELKMLSKKYEQIKVYENESNIAKIMAKCDVLISAASTVLYEACTMGIPTVFFCVADDQVNDAKYFVKEAAFLYAGDARENRIGCFQNVFSSIRDLEVNKSFLKAISEKSYGLIDGFGAKRIAEEIINL